MAIPTRSRVDYGWWSADVGDFGAYGQGYGRNLSAHGHGLDVLRRIGKRGGCSAATLIAAGGRLMLAILERMAKDMGGTYLLTDTDSMFFVASEKGGLFPCPGGHYKLQDGKPAVRAITWRHVDAICAKLNSLNPYDPNIVADILKIEECNYDRSGNRHQPYGLAVSAKRYVVYTRKKNSLEIIKPSEHGLGIVYVPDKRRDRKSVVWGT